MSLIGMLLIFGGTLWAETISQYRNQNQNRNQVQNRRQKQNLSCQMVLANAPETITGSVSECGYDGLVIISDGTEYIVNGFGPVSYWESLNIGRPSPGDAITVTFRPVQFSPTVEKNILFSLTFVEAEKTIELRDPVTGCPLWR